MTPSLARRCISEFLGTFALVAIDPGAVMVASRTHGRCTAALGLLRRCVANDLRIARVVIHATFT